MKIPDSSSYYIKKGLPLAKSKGEKIYYQFVFFEGVNLYHKKDYMKARDSMAKSLPFLRLVRDKAYLVNGYFYMGKVNEALKKIDKANSFYKKFDSVFRITEKHITPEVRESYESLIRYYKAKKDMENQLVYVERLLKFDSILYANKEAINEKLIKEYDTPELLEEKENLIASISDKNTRYAGFIKILIGIVVVISSLFYYQYRKRRLYRKRFETLINKTDREKTDGQKATDKAQEESIGISEDVVAYILSRLNKFEEKKSYLESNITAVDLAKRFNTNSKYLSNIVNFYKKKNFATYISDLRIDYVIEKLKTDKILRSYSIKAIAGEVGFGNAATFTKFFRKKTGLYPSYFMKELKKRKNETI